MNWIVKNETPEPAPKTFEERMAVLQPKVKAATEEELESWLKPELHDLCQAARIELRKRRGQKSNRNYSGAWVR